MNNESKIEKKKYDKRITKVLLAKKKAKEDQNKVLKYE